MPAHAALGRVIKRWRRERKLSQEAFGNEVELHRTYIGAIERGEQNVTLETVDKLLDATKLTLPELAELIERERSDGGSDG